MKVEIKNLKAVRDLDVAPNVSPSLVHPIGEA